MIKYREIIRLNALGINQTGISNSLGCARKTVRKVLVRAGELDLKWPLPDAQTDAILQEMFWPKSAESVSNRKTPDTQYIHKELMGKGVSLKLLWNEYMEECRQCNELPLMYSQFCRHYQKFYQTKRASMHIPRKPGQQIEVDWAGTTAQTVDRDTGEIEPVYIFVGALSYSQYGYVEAFPDQKQASWIEAHIHMFEYFGGVSQMIVPDNLKTGVTRSDWYNPEINRIYQEMAMHYNTAIIPARVRKPKDKPTAEGTVGIISTWIIAALRNEKFFTIAELNEAIRKKLDDFNKRPFQKKEGNRHSIFLGEEKPFLAPLPVTSYELAEWKIATVQFNYHISVDKMHYSVPYEYIKHKVDVRITNNVIEVFYHQNRICSHKRLKGRKGQYSTVEAHMPENHQNYIQWDSARFIRWAEKIGPDVAVVVKSILESHKIEQQGFKSCMGVIKLADKYSIDRLESACKKALTYTPRPSYKILKNILSSGQDKLSEEKTTKPPSGESEHGFIRGADYYRRYDS
jgi:transposase